MGDWNERIHRRMIAIPEFAPMLENPEIQQE
jgi:hypothetical protein